MHLFIIRFELIGKFDTMIDQIRRPKYWSLAAHCLCMNTNRLSIHIGLVSSTGQKACEYLVFAACIVKSRRFIVHYTQTTMSNIHLLLIINGARVYLAVIYQNAEIVIFVCYCSKYAPGKRNIFQAKMHENHILKKILNITRDPV